jgi:ribosome-binding protein aMBF1 (putative translation factor)
MANTDALDLAERVKNLRTRFPRPDGRVGLSQQELADLAGLHVVTVWKIENAQLRDWPREVTIRRLEGALGEKIVEWVEE